jgi:FMN-dependent NADH-azoreductase
MNILHIDSSIQGDSSVSRTVSAAVIDHLRDNDFSTASIYRDLVADPLPHITLPGFATTQASAIVEEFLAADVIVIGAPMYNFGIASQLKAWFDHILIAGKTFNYGANGVEGLAANKRVIVVISRGGIYSDGPAAVMEHAESHLRAMLGFIGIGDPEAVIAEGVALGAEQRDQALQAALARVEDLRPVPVAA